MIATTLLHYTAVEWGGLIAITPLLLLSIALREGYLRSKGTHLLQIHPIRELTDPSDPLRVAAGWTLKGMAVMAAAMALMGPWIEWEEENLPTWSWFFSPLQKEQSLVNYLRERILVIDNSGSMGVTDGPLGESRLERAKKISEALLRESDGEMFALYSSSGALFQLVPPTIELSYLLKKIRALSIGSEGSETTDLAAVAAELKKRYWERASNRRATIIWLTDGENSRGSEESRVFFEQFMGMQPSASLIAVGMGSTEGGIVPNVMREGQPVHSSQQSALLEQLAQTSHGRYIDSQLFDDDELVNSITAPLKGTEIATLRSSSSDERKGSDLSILFCSLSLLFFAAGKRLD